MYYPQEVDDIFLNEDTNIFDIEAAKRQKIRLLQQERTGTPVVLYSEDGTIKHEFTDKQPITNFPLKNSDQKDAPVIIYEFPIENPPYGLYVAGVDPYRQGKRRLLAIAPAREISSKSMIPGCWMSSEKRERLNSDLVTPFSTVMT